LVDFLTTERFPDRQEVPILNTLPLRPRTIRGESGKESDRCGGSIRNWLEGPALIGGGLKNAGSLISKTLATVSAEEKRAVENLGATPINYRNVPG
jgi:hypothetical protein